MAPPIDLFHRVARTVPAYRHFLAEHGIDPATVRTPADFVRLPLLTKETYLRRYDLPELCRDGRLEDCDMVAMSSGSTGEPTFWPRTEADERVVADRFEQVFRDGFEADRRRTLAVVCFALGTWVGGMFTTACCREMARRGLPVTVVTPGSNKDEILRVVPELGRHFDQVVLLGYPPFLKDVIDTGRSAGLGWERYSVKLVMAGEVFSEAWRGLVGERAGLGDPDADSASLYGTADAGVLGNETPVSVSIRRFLADHPAAAAELFGGARLPALVQYDPRHRYFEVTPEGTLVFSGDGGVPLIRYHIADEGGLVPHATMRSFLLDHGFEPPQGSSLPFVYVFGRTNFAVSYFGANVYPENIAVGLEQPVVSDWVTGKFVLSVEEDADHDRTLAVAVELAPGVAASPDRHARITESILTHLRRLNSEFANYAPEPYQTPEVTLLPFGDPEHFPPGVKHRYTRSR